MSAAHLRSTLITADRLLDGSSATIGPSAVLIGDARIAAVGRPRRSAYPRAPP
jgi:hypothetical protein